MAVAAVSPTLYPSFHQSRQLTHSVVEVVHVSVYEKLLEFQGVSPETPEIDHAFLEVGAKAFEEAKALATRDVEKRGCDGTTA